MKKAKLQIQGVEIVFDISKLELRKKGIIYKSKSRACREFTLFKEPIGIRISLENIESTPLKFQASGQILLEYYGKKYLEENVIAESEDFNNIKCESEYCYLPIDTNYESSRMILFAQILRQGNYFILNVNGYDYNDGTKKAPFEKLYELGKVMMESLTIIN